MANFPLLMLKAPKKQNKTSPGDFLKEPPLQARQLARQARSPGFPTLEYGGL